jgi:hypothetical protein
MKLILIILIGLCNNFIINAQNDSVYYAKITKTRTYMNIDRVSVTEYWFTKDKYCEMTNQKKTIVRRDLGVIYLINSGSGTVRIDSIKPTNTESTSEKPEDFKYIGQDYIPVFEWNQPKLLFPETIGKYECNHYICEGDADFDQISLDYLVAKTNDQIMANTMNSSIMNLGGSNNKREPIIKMITSDKNLIILRIIETVENPIAPHITTTINVDKLELLKSSEGLFDLPDNLKKSN